MLDDCDGGPIEVAYHSPSGVGVHEVVERQFPPMKLFGPGNAARCLLGRDVQSPLLMGVFTVPQAGNFGEGQLQRVGQGTVALAAPVKVSRNRVIVQGNVMERFRRQAAAFLHAQTVSGHTFRHPGIVGRVNNDNDGREVLGGCAEHGGATDVDVLQRIIQGNIRVADGGDEGVQVDRHEINGLYTVLCQFCYMVCGLTAGQYAGVYDRMQGLNSPFQDFGGASNVCHLTYGKAPFLRQGAVSATRADQLEPCGGNGPCELNNTGLVVNAY